MPTKTIKRIPKANAIALLEADDLVLEQVGGFINFLREHAIVGLAIGFVAGSQAQAVVKQLIASFIDPGFQLLGGKKLSDFTTTIHFAGNKADFLWGAMVYAIINLIIVLVIVYAVVKVLKLDKLVKPKDTI